MRLRTLAILTGVTLLSAGPTAQSRQSSPPGQPGDEMIHAYLTRQAGQIHQQFMEGVKSVEDWKKLRPNYMKEYFYMLGLDPMPEKAALKATVTGTLERDGYNVDMLYYQSMPRLYVTANLYRPKNVPAGRRLPAILYVCGHSNRGRNGNKTAYQSHGIWFARHGYICLTLDTLQLGEIAAIHHGTYREGRWWWHSRGYTSAGVECLNGIRGIDYLQSRSDVDPERIAVTGISGGGAATFWIAAADERAKVAVPVSGMSDLVSYVRDHVVNEHCDCMFLYNTFEWPWTRIAALIAPRPLLFVNSDQDGLFPMDGNERIINRLERLYSLYGAGDFVDSLVSIGGHAYRKDIRQAAYRFINTYLKDDPRVVEDSEVDLVTGTGNNRVHPIDPERLRVFPKDSDIPKDELNTTIDQHFVPMAHVKPPRKGQYENWKAGIVAELRRVVCRCFPERIPPAKLIKVAKEGDMRLESEFGIEVRLQRAAPEPAGNPKRILMVVQAASDEPQATSREPGDRVYVCSPRGVGPTRWTRRNPPNYVARAHALLGRTADTGRVWDVIAAARYLHDKYGGGVPVYVSGDGAAGVLAAYAALWEPEIAGVIASNPPLTHMDNEAPQFLNVLRVCDIPDVLGMLAPRTLTVSGVPSDALKKVAEIYAAAGASESFNVQ
ncbi:MAG: prolyl oligopeptidase family serine peptidase [Sedimentisphaerales bacterium]|jgi:dienelactone hydrolase